ncbi:4-hydroxythreonine-4-phosphate dehydrogenase PdxA [Spirosoma rhododendri]|uniref:4-hydroxythreonine-4-phosphate dehydrogenase PdxA n=1 Tax=Spirosoma rhododendri TaxID=2728024 RepID=A0A7L5DUQ2_9BACT|nr:4-hydroxythreonine-4-phosphate dehydrogenase PdxA [Spirosoma rhododendri]QJD79290.1 4-hydroxythreonine-4-phosphate dehydrogenase PdxA [Spirosoma rhododendri]
MEQRQSDDTTPDSLTPPSSPSADIQSPQPATPSTDEQPAQPVTNELAEPSPLDPDQTEQSGRKFTQRENGGRDNRQNGRHSNVQKDNRQPQRENGQRTAEGREQPTRENGQRQGNNQRQGNRENRDANGSEPRSREQSNRESGNQEPRSREQQPRNRNADSPETGNQEPRDREQQAGESGNQEPRSRDQQPRNRESGNQESRNRDQQSREQQSREREPRQREASVNESGDQSGRDAGMVPGDNRLVIGISMGDYNGIGPEVILKALQHNRLQKICTPVIYGSMRIMNRYRNLLDLKDWNLNGAPSISQISHKMTNVITCWPDQNQDIQPGQVTPEAGQAALACLQRAVADMKEGKLDALVTAPINKYNIQSEEFKFPGHTEYLADEFGVADNLMFMVSERLRVGVVTGHVPLGRVRQNVTRERILQKINLMMQSLKQDYGIDKPKIAVLGLNPHAGEEGLLGNEEQDIIKPLLNDLRNKGQLVFGPYPADGFFGTRSYTKFDAVLAMYHDQGLIPFKAIAFEEGVNFTAGMPVVRTSPDHGTAYDIAGKNLADETSMLQAIYTAIDVARQRKEYTEITANALK